MHVSGGGGGADDGPHPHPAARNPRDTTTTLNPGLNLGNRMAPSLRVRPDRQGRARRGHHGRTMLVRDTVMIESGAADEGDAT